MPKSAVCETCEKVNLYHTIIIVYDSFSVHLFSFCIFRLFLTRSRSFFLTCFQRFKTSSFQTRDRDRFLAGYTFGNIYRAVAFTELLKNPFEVHRSVLISHTEFEVKN